MYSVNHPTSNAHISYDQICKQTVPELAAAIENGNGIDFAALKGKLRKQYNLDDSQYREFVEFCIAQCQKENEDKYSRALITPLQIERSRINNSIPYASQGHATSRGELHFYFSDRGPHTASESGVENGEGYRFPFQNCGMARRDSEQVNTWIPGSEHPRDKEAAFDAAGYHGMAAVNSKMDEYKSNPKAERPPSVVNILQDQSGTCIGGSSMRKGMQQSFSKVMTQNQKEVLDSIPVDKRGVGHCHCGEVFTIHNALSAQDQGKFVVKGAESTAFVTYDKERKFSGLYKQACSSCKQMISYYFVEDREIDLTQSQRENWEQGRNKLVNQPSSSISHPSMTQVSSLKPKWKEQINQSSSVPISTTDTQKKPIWKEQMNQTVHSPTKSNYKTLHLKGENQT